MHEFDLQQRVRQIIPFEYRAFQKRHNMAYDSMSWWKTIHEPLLRDRVWSVESTHYGESQRHLIYFGATNSNHVIPGHLEVVAVRPLQSDNYQYHVEIATRRLTIPLENVYSMTLLEDFPLTNLPAVAPAGGRYDRMTRGSVLNDHGIPHNHPKLFKPEF